MEKISVIKKSKKNASCRKYVVWIPRNNSGYFLYKVDCLVHRCYVISSVALPAGAPPIPLIPAPHQAMAYLTQAHYISASSKHSMGWRHGPQKTYYYSKFELFNSKCIYSNLQHAQLSRTVLFIFLWWFWGVWANTLSPIAVLHAYMIYKDKNKDCLDN